MKIYLDKDFKCHLTDDGTRIAIETEIFNDKCNTFIEGYRFVPTGESWTREDGVTFTGEMITPWKPYSELAVAQKQFEEDEKVIAELDAALLDSTYQNIIGSIK